MKSFGLILGICITIGLGGMGTVCHFELPSVACAYILLYHDHSAIYNLKELTVCS